MIEKKQLEELRWSKEQIDAITKHIELLNIHTPKFDMVSIKKYEEPVSFFEDVYVTKSNNCSSKLIIK